MKRRKPYRITTRAMTWTNADGSTDPIVKLYGGSRASIAIDYSEIPALIAELANLWNEHQKDGVTHGGNQAASA